MNKQNNNMNSEHKGMMWMMVICCLVPVALLLSGSTLLKFANLRYVLIALIGVFVLFRLRHIFGLANHQKSNDKEKDGKDSISRGSCCH